MKNVADVKRFDDFDFQKEFYLETRNKKRIGSGAFHKKGKGVKHGITGGLRFGYENMSRKDKKEYMKASDVKVENMYETIVPYEEFKYYDDEKKKHLLIKWREFHNNNKIAKDLGISIAHFNKQISELNIPRKTRQRMDWDTHKNKGNLPDVIEYREFRKLDEDEQYVILDDLIKKYTKTKVMHEWNLTSNRFYKMIKKLGLMTYDVKDKKEVEPVEVIGEVEKEDVKMKEKDLEEEYSKEDEKEDEKIIKGKEEKQEKQEDQQAKKKDYGMILSLNEESLTSAEVVSKLNRWIGLIEDDNNDYEVSFSIKEIKNGATNGRKEQIKLIMKNGFEKYKWEDNELKKVKIINDFVDELDVSLDEAFELYQKYYIES